MGKKRLNTPHCPFMPAGAQQGLCSCPSACWGEDTGGPSARSWQAGQATGPGTLSEQEKKAAWQLPAYLGHGSPAGASLGTFKISADASHPQGVPSSLSTARQQAAVLGQQNWSPRHEGRTDLLWAQRGLQRASNCASQAGLSHAGWSQRGAQQRVQSRRATMAPGRAEALDLYWLGIADVARRQERNPHTKPFRKHQGAKRCL